MRDDRVAIDDPASLSSEAERSKSTKPRRRSSIGAQLSNILPAAVTKKQRRNSSLTMTKMASDTKHALATSTSRRVSFHPLVEMSLIDSFQEMTLDERRQRWLSAEDKIASHREMCISVLALRCCELGESTTEIRHRIHSVANNETEAEICFRGIEHHKSKLSQKVQKTIKQEHVATILREQQAYRLETGRSTGTTSFLLANVSYRNSRYSRERAVKLARLDEEYVKQQLRFEDEACAEEDCRQRGVDLEVAGGPIQSSRPEMNEKTVGHYIRNIPIENMKQKQSFPSCA